MAISGYANRKTRAIMSACAALIKLPTMKIKSVDGIAYFSIPTAAKYLGISKPALRKIALTAGLEFVNFRQNGTLWVTVESIKALRSGGKQPEKTD